MDNLFNKDKNKCSLVNLQYYHLRITQMSNLQKSFLKSTKAKFLSEIKWKIYF